MSASFPDRDSQSTRFSSDDDSFTEEGFAQAHGLTAEDARLLAEFLEGCDLGFVAMVEGGDESSVVWHGPHRVRKAMAEPNSEVDSSPRSFDNLK
jgi:hypothetical protein